MSEEQGRRLRDVMSRYPTGVTVVTALRPDGRPLGLTVNSFTSVSLDPPLVLVCINRASSSHDDLLSASSFGVSVLSADQGTVADRFAREPSETRFQTVGWAPGALGAPRLDGAAAWLECTRFEAHQAGDHTILVGRVESAEADESHALLFHRGDYGSVGG